MSLYEPNIVQSEEAEAKILCLDNVAEIRQRSIEGNGTFWGIVLEKFKAIHHYFKEEWKR